MNGSKLTAGITSVVIGSLLFISTLANASLYSYYLGGGIVALMIIISLSELIAGAFFCSQYGKKGTAVTLLVINLILFILELVGAGAVQTQGSGTIILVLELLAFLTIIVCCIAYLSPSVFTSKSTAVNNTQPNAATQNPAQSGTANTAAPAPQQFDSVNEKIKLLRELRENGDISEESYKELLLKELNK